MKEFLFFTLYAPLAAMGEIAVGERRSSWERPARSAIMGLVAAALGIERSQEISHKALDREYGFAVFGGESSSRLQDFHTAQVLPAAKRRKKKNVHTRADELSVDSADLRTVISYREYCIDAFFTIALWKRIPSPCWPLRGIVSALKEPQFNIYFGRKSCPLGLPMNPEIIEAADVIKAFRRRPLMPQELVEQFQLIKKGPLKIYADEDAVNWDECSDVMMPSRFHRYEGTVSRENWLFQEREMGSGLLQMGSPEK